MSGFFDIYPETEKSRIIRQATSTRPLIRIFEHNGHMAVIKDFRPNGFFYRNIVGRFLTWREAKAYRQLSTLPGVPRLLAVVDGPALIMEAVAGMDIKEATKQKPLDPGFFNALKDLVDGIHEKGLAHCDLKASGNILVTPDGNPFILDWGASISKKEFRCFPLNLIYKRFLVDDHRAVTKHKLRYLPDSVSLEEKKQYDHRSWAERTIRMVRDKVRVFLQKIA